MRKLAILAAFCAALAGCSTSKVVTLPDGTAGQLVRCNGTLNSFAGCAEEAGKACPAGYAVLTSDQERGVAALPDGNGGLNRIPTATRFMMIKCKPGSP